MLNVAVKQKRLADNPCRRGRVSGVGKKVDSQAALHDGERAGEDRVRGSKLPAEYRRDSVGDGAALQEGASSDEEGAGRSGKWLVHIADSKTVNGIGDMPMTAAAREAFQRQIEETPGSEYLFPSPITQPAASRT
jgi:hypothetical protein